MFFSRKKNIIVASLFVFVFISRLTFAQSLEWGQYAGPSISKNLHYEIEALEKAPGGAIYTYASLWYDSEGSGEIPVFNTQDIVSYGDFDADGHRVGVLSKYSSDGTTLEWVRIISRDAPEHGPYQGAYPIDIKIDPNNNVYIVTNFNWQESSSSLITADAEYPLAPEFVASFGNGGLLLNKFSPLGDLMYGSYLPVPANGDWTISNTGDLDIGADGRLFYSYTTSNKSLPTTAGAYPLQIESGTNSSMPYMMILNPDHSLDFATYLSVLPGDGFLPTSLSTNSKSLIAANGDYYTILTIRNTFSGIGKLPNLLGATSVPETAAINPDNLGSLIDVLLRFGNDGAFKGGTYLPRSKSTYNPFGDITSRPNGNIIISTDYGTLIEFDEALETIIQEKAVLAAAREFKLDDYGRLHILSEPVDPEYGFPLNQPTTAGALLSNTDNIYRHYQVLDCDFSNLIYGTRLPGMKSGHQLALDGCHAYIGGGSTGPYVFSATPTAYDSNGSPSLTGYDITTSTGSDGVLFAFNFPELETGSNIITAPPSTTICNGGSSLPITGSTANYLTPTHLGEADDNPAPATLNYQWQVASSASGPWEVVTNSNTKDFDAEPQSVIGEYFYRRLVQQFPFDTSLCSEGCVEADTSNVVSLTYTNFTAPSTNISSVPYGLCEGSIVSIDVDIAVEAGQEAPDYGYKLTTLTNLLVTFEGQEGTLNSSSNPINLSVSQPGSYLLATTDARGCATYDTLTVEQYSLDAGSASVFTCLEASVELGAIPFVDTYANSLANPIEWSPAAGLDNPNALRPIFTHGLAEGESVTKYVSLNGCLLDSVTIFHQSINPLPALPDLVACQGVSLSLGKDSDNQSLITRENNVSYEWAPGIGLSWSGATNPTVTTTDAGNGSKEINYTLLASGNNNGCTQTTSQKVTIYKQPNQSFNVKECFSYNCSNPSDPLRSYSVGTVAEEGIGYSWTATVTDLPENVGNNGVPTDAEALSWLSSTTAAKVDVVSTGPDLGHADLFGYTVTYVRTSYNLEDPSCMRTDTAELSYCCGENSCREDLGNMPAVSCGGVDNRIGSSTGNTGGSYYWSRLDGQPLNNELFDTGTGDPLTGAGPHPKLVVANPSGYDAIDYQLLWVQGNGSSRDSCIVDIRVFPAAVSTPTIDYPAGQSVCPEESFTIEGPAERSEYEYSWSPEFRFVSEDDLSVGLPNVSALSDTTSLFVRVTDPSTGCYIDDTISINIPEVIIDAGSDGTFCNQGEIKEVGIGDALSGYTYSWSAIPSAGVVFEDNTVPITNVTLPSTTDGDTIRLVLEVTNTLSAPVCSLTDTLLYIASSTLPAINLLPKYTFCSGGQVTINASALTGTYAWTGSSILSGQGTPEIVVDAIGTYELTFSRGGCSVVASTYVENVVEPTVDLSPEAPCADDATIGAVGVSGGWEFSWDKYDGLKSYLADFSTITVRPTVETTYTLTATHASGCTRTYEIVVPAAEYKAELPTVLNFCLGETATILPLNDYSSVGGSVVWTSDPSSGEAYLSSTTDQRPSIDLNTAEPGTYTYTATVTYGIGCESTESVRVNIGGQPILNIAGDNQEICSGECVSVGGDWVTDINYLWSASPNDQSISNKRVLNPTVCPTESTVYTLTYSDVAGCVNTDEVLVRVVPSPELEVQDITICQNAAADNMVDLSTAITANTGTSVSYWLNSNATIPSSQNVSLSTTYYIKSENEGGCSVLMPVSIGINSLPNLTLDAEVDCDTKNAFIKVLSQTENARYAYSVGDSYSGAANYETAIPISDGEALIYGLAFPPENGQDYTVRVFDEDGFCYTDAVINMASSCPCTPPSAVATTNQATCRTSGGSNNDGEIIVSGFEDGQRYQYSQGTTFDSNTAIESAITAIPANGIIESELVNATETYTVRIYDSADNTCFIDIQVSSTGVVCPTPCPQPNCLTISVIKK